MFRFPAGWHFVAVWCSLDLSVDTVVDLYENCLCFKFFHNIFACFVVKEYLLTLLDHLQCRGMWKMKLTKLIWLATGTTVQCCEGTGRESGISVTQTICHALALLWEIRGKLIYQLLNQVFMYMCPVVADMRSAATTVQDISWLIMARACLSGNKNTLSYAICLHCTFQLVSPYTVVFHPIYA
jgi:hypothetical protein